MKIDQNATECQSIPKSKICKYCLGLLIVLIVTCIGFYVGNVYSKSCREYYPNINPELACESKKYSVNKKEYAALRANLIDYTDKQLSLKKVTDISVYFRDLIDGPIFGINELNNFAPASLLKLPLAVTYYIYNERMPGLLDEKVVYNGGNSGAVETFSANKNLIKGKTYTIRELIHIMIAQSDNDAYVALIEFLLTKTSAETIKSIYLEMGIIAPRDSVDEVISVRRYASILRGLYNVSVLNEADSNELLGYMIDGDFRKGIQGPLPATVEVANKYGERELVDGDKQLHDCGIIYYPNNPYLLCVMTKGRDYEEMLGVIREISSQVYKEFDSRKL